MENFVHSNIAKKLAENKWQSFSGIYQINKRNSSKQWIWGSLILLLVITFLPWTQNIKTKGLVTTLRQEQRLQEVNTVIAGKVLKWYVKEGDFVKAGDTILQLGEVKMEYLDPQLLNRTKEQIDAKQSSIQNYQGKANSNQQQVAALLEGRDLKLSSLDNKLSQQKLKVAADSLDLIAVNNELLVYKRQIDAARMMLDSGAISLSDFEKRKINYQNGLAKKGSTENKYLQGKQEIANLSIEKNSVIQDYADKIAKAEGEKFTALSTIAGTEAEISKLKNLYANYDARNQWYYLIAPQSGQLISAKKAGIGEMVKEGEQIVQMVPNQIEYAVEMFVEPMDLPLISIGQKVRFIFDGFPAIVFSGWPNSSYGTFGGIVAAIETGVSKNGKFRVLVKEDQKEKKWPAQLKIGAGASGIALLKDVPIYYELWRNVNGFPPEYYQSKHEK